MVKTFRNYIYDNLNIYYICENAYYMNFTGQYIKVPYLCYSFILVNFYTFSYELEFPWEQDHFTLQPPWHFTYTVCTCSLAL